MIDPNDELLFAELKRDEDEADKAYDDKTGKPPVLVGKLTIGIGRNLTDVGLSPDEILYLWRNDLARVRADLDRNAAWWRRLDPVRARALQNMCFNLGWPRLAGFKKALAAMQAGDWSAASAEMLNSKWASDVGDRAKRLARMVRTGVA